MRILHWNIHSWRTAEGTANHETVAQRIKETDPDVVALVEVDETPWGAPSVLPQIAHDCGYAWAFIPALEFGTHTPSGGFGNALLTRTPLLAVQQWNLLWPPPHYDGTEPSEPRTLLAARLDTPTGPMWVGATHLPRHSAHARTAALTQLRQFIDELDDPWLVCGDFNTPATWFDDKPWAAEPADTPTYPTSTPTEAIDYCLASHNGVIDAQVLTVTGSDHLPVLINLTR